MRVTLSLRNNYCKVVDGHAIDVPLANEPTTDAILDEFTVIGTPDAFYSSVRSSSTSSGQRFQEAQAAPER